MEKGTVSLICDKTFYLGHKLLRNNDCFLFPWNGIIQLYNKEHLVHVSACLPDHLSVTLQFIDCH